MGIFDFIYVFVFIGFGFSGNILNNVIEIYLVVFISSILFFIILDLRNDYMDVIVFVVGVDRVV